MIGRRSSAVTRRAAEKLFGRKANPEADMKPNDFLKKEMEKAMRGVKNYGKNVAGGAKIVREEMKKLFKK